MSLPGLGGAVRRLYRHDDLGVAQIDTDLAVVHEAQRQTLVALLQQGDRLLEVVLALAADPEHVKPLQLGDCCNPNEGGEHIAKVFA